MKKRGFTLIELLGVIILLAIIAVIVVPVVKNIIKDAKTKTLEEQKYSIITSAKNWAIKNGDLLPDSDESIFVDMETLRTDGFLENKKIVDPITKKEMIGCVEIKYDNAYSQYDYKYVDECN